MILGTRNFTQEYNGTYVPKNEAFEIINYFQDNGGEIIDCAYNYDFMKHIKESGWEGKVINKVNNENEFARSLDILGVEKYYCCMVRKNDSKMIEYLKSMVLSGIIEKFGISCYLPQELTESYFNVIQIPCDPIWFKYINTMSLYAKVIVRSYYNIFRKNYEYYRCKDTIKLERYIACEKVELVIGVDNLEQLKFNMDKY